MHPGARRRVRQPVPPRREAQPLTAPLHVRARTHRSAALMGGDAARAA